LALSLFREMKLTVFLAEVDLFSFDDPTPAPVAAPVTAADDFGDFTGSSGGAAAASDEFDAFGSFKAAPVQQNAQFDAFATQSAPVATNNNMGQVNDMFGQMNVGNPGMMNNNTMNGGAMMGGMPQQQQAMMGGMPQQQQQFAAADDDFGDFEDAAPKKAMSMNSLAPSTTSDPLSRLISLDSLEKNKKQPVSMMGQPITANSAAMQYVQNQSGGAYATPNPNMSFQNIDGLGNTNNGFGSPAANNGFGSPAAPVGGMAMGSATAGGADVIAMMGPVPTSMVSPQQQQQQQRQQQQRQQQQQYQGMPGGFPQKQQQGGMQQQGNTGTMNPQMMQQANMTMQGGMQQQGNMGMMNPQMMQQGNMGGMNNMQGGMQSGNMQQQGMGGMQQQGMQGNMPGGSMGGHPMQGWR
jgi:hypothetical protein